MKKFTVLLLYPDYVASQYGEEVYLAEVEARTPKAAAAIAQGHAAKANGIDELEQANDFMCLMVVAGWRECLYSEARNL